MDKEELLNKMLAEFVKLQNEQMESCIEELVGDVPEDAFHHSTKNEKMMYKYIFRQAFDLGFKSAIEEVKECLNREKRAFIVSLKDDSESEIVFAESEKKAKEICEFRTQDGVMPYELTCERAERYDGLENQEEKILLEKWKSGSWSFNATTLTPNPQEKTDEEFLDWYFNAEWE